MFLRRLKQCVYIHTVHIFKRKQLKQTIYTNKCIYIYIYKTYPHNCTHVCQASLSPIQGFFKKLYLLIPTFLLSSGAFPFFSQLHSLLFNSFSFAATCVARQESYGVGPRGAPLKWAKIRGQLELCNLYKYSFIAITLLLTGRCPPCINILLNKLTELN